MDYMYDQRIAEAVQQALPQKRWQHTLGVMTAAQELAERFGADPKKAELAALLHDYAKYWPADEMAKTIRQDGRDLDVLDYDEELWHGPVGALAAAQEFGIMDEDILDAVRYHTSGRVGMTMLDKVICLADYIEPGRAFQGVEQIRALALEDINRALVTALDSTLEYLIAKGCKIFPQTLHTRNWLIDEMTQG